MKEEILQNFLKKLDEKVFTNSINSVTTKEEKLNPTIEDMEAIIKISGEWDREDLKDILFSFINLPCPDCGFDGNHKN